MLANRRALLSLKRQALKRAWHYAGTAGMCPFSEVSILCGDGTRTAKQRHGRLREEGSEGSLRHSDDLTNRNSLTQREAFGGS